MLSLCDERRENRAQIPVVVSHCGARGGKSTTRCTDLEMCDRRRTRNSSEAVRKSNYENVEHATQREKGREKNRGGGRERRRAQKESPVEERNITDTRFFMQSEKSRRSKSYRDVVSRRISDRVP